MLCPDICIRQFIIVCWEKISQIVKYFFFTFFFYWYVVDCSILLRPVSLSAQIYQYLSNSQWPIMISKLVHCVCPSWSISIQIVWFTLLNRNQSYFKLCRKEPTKIYNKIKRHNLLNLRGTKQTYRNKSSSWVIFQNCIPGNFHSF